MGLRRHIEGILHNAAGNAVFAAVIALGLAVWTWVKSADPILAIMAGLGGLAFTLIVTNQVLELFGRGGKHLDARIAAALEHSRNRLQATSRTSTAVGVRLADRHFEFQPDAWEYYQHVIQDHHREKIHDWLRRRPMLFEITKRALVMVVEEKTRIKMMLDDFIGEGESLRRQAREIEDRLRSQLSPVGLSAALLGAVPSSAHIDMAALFQNVRAWEHKVFAFLKDNTPGHAQEFFNDVGLDKSALDERIAERMARLTRIKSVIAGGGAGAAP